MNDLLLTLNEHNPHWVHNLPDLGVKRTRYIQKIFQYLETGEIVVLNGVRRSGKTTILKQTISELISRGQNPANILFVSCDDPMIQKIDEPLPLILETYLKNISVDGQVTLIFDEIQTISKWELWLKSWYDRKKYNIIISGSSSKILDSGLSSKISGRYLSIHVYPLNFAEFLQFKNINIPTTELEFMRDRYSLASHIREYIRYGGFPAPIHLDNMSMRLDHLSTYFDSIIVRDIEELHEIRNTATLRKLLVHMVTNIASPYSYRKLGLSYGIDTRVVVDYLNFAHDAFLLFEVGHFSYSLKNQNQGYKKIYTIDTGLRNSVSFSFSEDEGRLVENIVFVSLLQLKYQPYYWNGKNEVDFVVQHRDHTVSLINVCYSDDIPEREIKGIHEFLDVNQGKIKACVIITKDVEKEEGGIIYVPLVKWLLGWSEKILKEEE